jgi:hypothetical protein
LRQHAQSSPHPNLELDQPEIEELSLIPIIGSSGGEERSRRMYAPEEEVPESGIYGVIHETGEQETVVLLRAALFPECEECGKKVRYKVLQTAPYIFHDEDFK